MNILFDLVSSQPFASDVKYNGGAQYVKSLFLNFIATNKKYDNNVFGLFDSSLDFDSDIKALCFEKNIILLDLKFEKIENLVKKYEIDKIFIGIGQRFLNSNFPGNIKLIIVIHDLRDLEIMPSRLELLYLTKITNFTSLLKLFLILIFHPFWKHYRFKTNYKRYKRFFLSALKTNIEFWTVSNHTKYILTSQFSFIDELLVKVFWAPNINFTSNKSKIAKLEGEKFYLFIASNNWEKNPLKIIESFIHINRYCVDKKKLLLIGNLNSTLLKLKIKKLDWIINLSSINNSEIEWAYSKAEALLYPSYVEGFGYPPVQAMKYGTPVLASSSSSIYEICLDAPFYCCPFSSSEILARLTYLLSNDLSFFQEKSLLRFLEIQCKQNNDLSLMLESLHT